MAEFIYLIRNEELYSIGQTESLERIKKSLSPGILEAVLETNDSKAILKILFTNYAKKRLPQTNYFRLTTEEFNECKRQLERGRSKDDFKPFFSGTNLLFTFIVAWLLISLIIIKFGIQPIFNQFN